MIRKLLAVLFIGNIFFTYAQEISGALFDKVTGEALISASVTIKGTTTGALTDLDGKFHFKPTQKPPFTLVFAYVGYAPFEQLIKSEADYAKTFKVQLSSSEVVTKEVTIVDSRITEKQKESPLTIESMGLQQIKSTASSTFYEGLGTLKGVDATSASLGFVVINTRGFNSTSPVRSLQLLDGADNQAPGLNFSIGNFAGATELDIQKVDIIVGASTPLYGPNAFNGVISMQTKNPFFYQGLSVYVKGAERNLFEGALRYARAFKNKKGMDKFAFKVNFSYLRADDWQANNLAPASNSSADQKNYGGYNAVNIYGDEQQFGKPANNAAYIKNNPGLGFFYRTGYQEKDLVDYNLRNIKANASLHYKITNKIEAKVAYNFGTGTTVYQGDNRYSLKGIQFHQIKAEIGVQDKWYIRAYTTMDDAANSYDAVFTALRLQEATGKTDAIWQQYYLNAWSSYKSKIIGLLGYNSTSWGALDTFARAKAMDSIYHYYGDTLNLYHQKARSYADTFDFGGVYSKRFIPGTAQYDSLKRAIISKTTQEGGTRFYDKSKLFHIQGEYKWEIKKKGTEKLSADITAGASFRMYFPDSKGTIFTDTLIRNYQKDGAGNFVLDSFGNKIATDSSRAKIKYMEYGLYVGFNKRFYIGQKDVLVLSGTVRFDKTNTFNQYAFDFNGKKDAYKLPFIYTPALSLVYTHNNNHTIRISFSSAIRNPTLQDQFLYYNVGRAILVGNLRGVDSLVTTSSLIDYYNSSNDASKLKWINAPAVRPEKARSIEVGYKGIIGRKVYIDGSGFVSFYKDFLGYKIGAKVENSATGYNLKQVYRVATNSQDQVMTYGVSLGVNYYFITNYAVTGNYSWNKLDRRGSNDPIIPAFNTPEHKFNVGVNGKDIKIGNVKGFGFLVNYKWLSGYTFEGSPQFTGDIKSYSLLDAQITWNYAKIYSTFKFGASNIVSKMNYQVYGGPAVGRMIYGSILVDLKDLF